MPPFVAAFFLEECRHEWRHGSLEGYATVAWSMEGRGGYVCFNDGSSGRGKWTWRWHGAGGGRRAKSGSGGDPRGPGGPPHQNYVTAPGSGRYRGTAHEDGAVR